MKLFLRILTLTLTLISGLSLANPAGVLPVSTFNGKAVVLLGEDHHRKGFYTDFGGKAEPGEAPYQTAAREFCEESLNMFTSNHKGVASVLKNKTPIINGIYYMYPLDVQFLPARQFKQKTDSIIAKKGLRYLLRNLHAEKINFAWVYASDLYNALRNANSNNGIWVKTINPNHPQIQIYPFCAKGLRTTTGLNWLSNLSKAQFAQQGAQITNAAPNRTAPNNATPKRVAKNVTPKRAAKNATPKRVAKNATPKRVVLIKKAVPRKAFIKKVTLNKAAPRKMTLIRKVALKKAVLRRKK